MKRRISRGLLINAGLLAGALLSAAGLSHAQISLSTSFLPFLLRNWPPPSPTPLPAWVLLTEVLYDPLGDEPAGEWIELANIGDCPLDISSYLVGDEETPGGREGMYQFPPGSSILPRQVIVVANRALTFSNFYGFAPDFELNESDPLVPTMVEYSLWSAGPLALENASDELLLRENMEIEVDSVSWGGSTYAFDPGVVLINPGWSLERSPANRDTDQAGDWTGQPFPNPGIIDLSTPTPTITHTPAPTPSTTPTASLTPIPSGSSTVTPASDGTTTPTFSPTPEQSSTPPTQLPQRLLVSEVLYDPNLADEPDGEWIELFNPGDSPIELEDVKVGDEETAGGGEGMVFFPAGARIEAHQTLVIANQAEIFYSIHGFLPDYELADTRPEVPELARYSAWASGTIALNNSGDEIILLDREDKWWDALSWGSSSTVFDPAVPLVAPDHSLERYPPDVDNNNAADWRDQSQPSPGHVDWTPPTPAP